MIYICIRRYRFYSSPYKCDSKTFPTLKMQKGMFSLFPSNLLEYKCVIFYNIFMDQLLSVLHALETSYLNSMRYL